MVFDQAVLQPAQGVFVVLHIVVVKVGASVNDIHLTLTNVFHLQSPVRRGGTVPGKALNSPFQGAALAFQQPDFLFGLTLLFPQGGFDLGQIPAGAGSL